MEMVKLVNHVTIYYLCNLSERQSSAIIVLSSFDDNFQRLQKEMVQNNNLSNIMTTRKAEDDWEKDWNDEISEP